MICFAWQNGPSIAVKGGYKGKETDRDGDVYLKTKVRYWICKQIEGCAQLLNHKPVQKKRHMISLELEEHVSHEAT
jgi:hypothetical protein